MVSICYHYLVQVFLFSKRLKHLKPFLYIKNSRILVTSHSSASDTLCFLDGLMLVVIRVEEADLFYSVNKERNMEFNDWRSRLTNCQFISLRITLLGKIEHLTWGSLHRRWWIHIRVMNSYMKYLNFRKYAIAFLKNHPISLGHKIPFLIPKIKLTQSFQKHE